MMLNIFISANEASYLGLKNTASIWLTGESLKGCQIGFRETFLKNIMNFGWTNWGIINYLKNLTQT